MITNLVKLRHESSSWTVYLGGTLIALLAVWLTLGGVKLLMLNGSPYYLLAGVALLLVAAAIFLRRSEALLIFAVFLLSSTVWALREVGLDWWQLVPRVSWWWLIGILLALPWVGGRIARTGRVPRAHNASLIVVLTGVVLVGVISGFVEPHELRGELPVDNAVSPLLDPAEMRVSGDWPHYGGSASGQRYSPLTSITPKNVFHLKVAWRFRTGDNQGPDDPSETTYENTPLKVGETLYLCTPHNRVIALDASTGRERWRFDPSLTSPEGFKHFEHMTCRGVSYHDGILSQAAASGAQSAQRAATLHGCQRRIFLPTADARLIALDADTGLPCKEFGDQGTVNLRTQIGPFKPGSYYSTSPPMTTRDLVIIGGHVSDNASNDEPSGVIRAFDVRTGKLVWNWDAGNPQQTFPLPADQIYTRNSPNMWSIMSADEGLGLVYLPMGNQTPDQWGGERTPESERYSAGIVALEIATGNVRWSRQFVHHDLWDMDVGGQPSLMELNTHNGVVPVLVASTKQGSVFVLDRRNGMPVLPVVEKPAPQGAVESDRVSRTQPESILSFSPPVLREADMWGATPYDQLWCRIHFRSLRYEGMFTPPSLQGTLVYPGNFGVFDWGGISVDPEHQVMLANPNYMAFTSRLLAKPSGNNQEQVPTSELISKPHHFGARIWEVVTWSVKRNGHDSIGEAKGIKRVGGIPYDIELLPLLSPLGIPCQAPPWGYVAGVDLQRGRIAWKHKNGTIRDSAPLPIPFPLGVPSLGGMLTTAGGVAFLTGSLDNYVRAYDVRTGTTIWKDRLPAGGQATPLSYADDSGRQYLLVTAGGHGSLGTRSGDYVIAYTLP